MACCAQIGLLSKTFKMTLFGVGTCSDTERLLRAATAASEQLGQEN